MINLMIEGLQEINPTIGTTEVIETIKIVASLQIEKEFPLKMILKRDSKLLSV